MKSSSSFLGGLAVLIASVCVVTPATAQESDALGNLLDPGGEARSRTKCVELDNGFAKFFMKLVVQGSTITGGDITGNICDSPNWDVTGGTYSAASLVVDATYTGTLACASPFVATGTGSGFIRWAGTYCFNTTCFPFTAHRVRNSQCQ